MASGREIAKENVAKFETWVEERRTTEDWSDYIRSNQLNRSEIAKECQFAISALRQNPAIKSLLTSLEVELMKAGVLKVDERTTTEKATVSRTGMKQAQQEARISQLEQQNALLRAEADQLKDSLKKYDMFEKHLADTGRMIKP